MTPRLRWPLLLVTLALFSLAGCGGEKDKDSNRGKDRPQQTVKGQAGRGINRLFRPGRLQ
jgi:hypothetical protein